MPKECLQKVSINSIKREEKYFEFKLDVYTEREKKEDTDMVLEVTPPEVGHLKINNYKMNRLLFH